MQPSSSGRRCGKVEKAGVQDLVKVNFGVFCADNLGRAGVVSLMVLWSMVVGENRHQRPEATKGLGDEGQEE